MALDALRELTSSITEYAQEDTIATTLEAFKRPPKQRKRLVVLGATGAGKSTLLNILAGHKFAADVSDPTKDFHFEWIPKPNHETDDASPDDAAPSHSNAPLFETAASAASVTKKTALANLSFLGDPARPFTAIDTPGHDDSEAADIDSPAARERLGEMAADLHNKLRALGAVHAILVLHNDVHSNRLNPATYVMLKMLSEKFAAAGTTVWDHVIVGYSKCNAHDYSWQSGFAAKCEALRAAIREKIPDAQGAELPVIALGGAELLGADDAVAARPRPPPSGFEKLWAFLSAAAPLDCTQLQPFEGADVKWAKMVAEKDEAEARAQAALVYVAVLTKLALFGAFLFWRAVFLPRVLAIALATALCGYAVHAGLSAADAAAMRFPVTCAAFALLIVNFQSMLDELALVLLFVHAVGPETLGYSLRHFHSAWLVPRLGPQYVAVLESVAPTARALANNARQVLLSAVSQEAAPQAKKAKDA